MVRNLLVGNGFLIEFGGADFTNKSIVLRTLENFGKSDFPSHIITDDAITAKYYFAKLFSFIKNILKDEYDVYCNCSAEQDALSLFKKRYGSKKSLQMSDIGFEDYYLVHDLVSHKFNVTNPEQFIIREAIKESFFHAIYNQGKLCTVYTDFSPALIEFLNSYNFIFTTNYDNNIEKAINKDVYHIHGSFFELADIYNIQSFRNQFSDHPLKDYVIDTNYFYLYSNAISAHCGDYKKFTINQGKNANAAVEKFACSYQTDNSIKEAIDNWKFDKNAYVVKLYEAVQIKLAHPEIFFSEPYHSDEFVNMSGDLDIIGLSPYNDFHLFDMINQSPLDNITFYFYDESECDVVSQRFCNKTIKMEPIKKLWGELK